MLTHVFIFSFNTYSTLWTKKCYYELFLSVWLKKKYTWMNQTTGLNLDLSQGLTYSRIYLVATPIYGFCVHIAFLSFNKDSDFRVKLHYFSNQVNKIWLKTVNKTKKIVYAQNIYSSFYINFSSLIFLLLLWTAVMK